MGSNLTALEPLPAYGYPGFKFYLIHWTGIVGLTLSIFFSVTVLLYMLYFASPGSLFQRQIGERLVVYLAVFDLGFSLSHVADHVYMLITKGHPPDPMCRTIAFLLQTFTIAQSFLIFFTATNAMIMVVLNKKLELGQYDWRLLTVTLGVPTSIGIAGVAVPFLGASGPWCLVDARFSYSSTVSITYSMAFVTVFFANAICYGMIYYKVCRLTRITASKENTPEGKYTKVARMMIMFIAAYLFQWWTYVVLSIWFHFGEPSIWFFLVTIIFTDLGGVYNAVVYTIIRKKYTQTNSISPSC